MADEDWTYVPISIEYLMSELFGKLQYHGYVGAVSRSTWKKDLLKVAKYIKRAVLLNVETDAIHRKKVLATCDALLQDLGAASTINAANAAVIEHLIRLVFLLLGNMPDHWRRRSPYSDSFWKLNGHRTLHYSQSVEQKVATLINAVDIQKRVEVPLEEHPNLHEAFYLGFKGNSSEFLTWFKNKYPAAYCEVF